MSADTTASPLLAVRDLAISALGLAITTGTNLEIRRGETGAIVGESGSGKSLTAKAIARLLPPGVTATGRILYDGVDLMSLPERAMRDVRGRRLSMMLQDPFTMLLMRSIKDRPGTIAIVTVILLVMRFVDIYWLVTPAHHGEHFYFSWTTIPAFFGIGGLWLAAFIWQLKGQTIIPIHETWVEEAIREGALTRNA